MAGWHPSSTPTTTTPSTGLVYNAYPGVYGLVGNGTADDTPALANLLSLAIATGGLVKLFPCSGGYRVKPSAIATAGSLPYGSNMTIEGSGWQSRLVMLAADYQDGIGGRLFRNVNGGGVGDSHVEFRNLWIDGPGMSPGANPSYLALDLGATTSTLTGPLGHCDHCVIDGLTITNWPGRAVAMFSVRYSTFRNIVLQNIRRGGFGISHDSLRCTVSHLQVDECEDDNFFVGAFNGGTGPSAVFPSWITADHLTLSNEQVIGNANVHIYGAQHVLITNLQGNGAGSANISIVNEELMDASDITIDGFEIENSLGYGFLYRGGYQITTVPSPGGGGGKNVYFRNGTVKNSAFTGGQIRQENGANTLEEIHVENVDAVDCGQTEAYSSFAFITPVASLGATAKGVYVNVGSKAPGGRHWNQSTSVNIRTLRVKVNGRNPHRVGTTIGSNPATPTGSLLISAIQLAGTLEDFEIDGEMLVNELSNQLAQYAISLNGTGTYIDGLLAWSRARKAQYRVAALSSLGIAGASNVRARENSFEQGIPAIVSAGTLTVRGDGVDGENFFTVTGAATITDIVANPQPMLMVFNFTGGATITNGNHWDLASNFAGTWLFVEWDGSVAHELARR